MNASDIFHIAIDIGVLLIAGYIIWDVVRAYKAASGTALRRLVTASKGAAASLWTGFTVIVTVAVNGLAQFAGLVNEPSVAAAIQTYGQPKYVAIAMIASAFVIALANKMRSA